MQVTIKNGYIENYALLGTINDSVEIEDPSEEVLENFVLHHTAYKVEDNKLILDEEKLAADIKTKGSEELSKKYIPSEIQSTIAIGKIILAQFSELDDSNRIRVSGLYPTWEAGKYEVGDIRNYNNQTWECFQAHDNSVDPDIKPNNAVWFTFWRPLHGKSPETARPFVPAHDMYHTGEYAYFNGKLYKCIQDTAYSPEDCTQAWQEEE